MIAPPKVDGAIAISLLNGTQNTSMQKASNGNSATTRLSRYCMVFIALSLQLISDTRIAGVRSRYFEF